MLVKHIGLKLTLQNNVLPDFSGTINQAMTAEGIISLPGMELYGCTQDNFVQLEHVLILLSGQVEFENKQLTPRQIAETYLGKDEGVISNLSGNFCLILVDLVKQEVICMTDKIGTLNLFYHSNDSEIIISNQLSWLKSQIKHTLNYCKQSLYHFIYYHCIPSPFTVYENVFKLEPARVLTWKNGALQNRQYWLPTFTDNSTNFDAPSHHQQLRQALNDSTGQFADQSDVGAFLSGGLDSSSVAVFLAKNSKKPINTFTIGFSEPGYDEKPFAQAVANAIGSNHTVYDVTPKDIYEYLPQIAGFYDEPFGNSSALPTFFCAKVAAEHGIKTMLAGDGGDELYAGNARYAHQKKFHAYTESPAFLQAILNSTVPLASRLPIGLFKKANSYIHQARMDIPERLLNYNFLHQNDPATVFVNEFLSHIDQTLPLQQMRERYNELKDADEVDNMLYLDWKFTLADNDLMKVNYMTAFAGIEVKYPMLSEKMLSLSCAIPADVKLPGQKLRDFYKQAMTGVLPDSTINKSKQGFGLPFGKWLAKDKALMDLTSATLAQFKSRDIISHEFIDQAMQSHQNSNAHYYGELVWIMLMLELWLQQHS
jgi:asparagine synthase (glutamine-hydrolysing)